MPSLEDDYPEVERQCAWVRELKNGPMSGQRYRVHKGLVKAIRKRSLRQNLTPQRYRARLVRAGKFLDDLERALPPDKDAGSQQIWTHRQSVQKVVGLGRKEPIAAFPSGGASFGYWLLEEDAIDVVGLQRVTADYLARPWMQHNEIDWILLDALIYGEIVGVREYGYSGEAFGKINWAYYLAEGKLGKAAWIRLMIEVSKWTARYVLPPPIIAGLFFLGYARTTIAAAVLYIVYLAARVALWPHRHRKRKRLRQEFEEFADRWARMLAAYELCAPPVISPTALREQVAHPTRLGPEFTPAVIALVDRILVRDRDVFLPFHSP